MKACVSDGFQLNVNVLKLLGLLPSDHYKTMHKIYGFKLYFIGIYPLSVLGVLRFILSEEVLRIDFNDYVIAGTVFFMFKFFSILKNGIKIKKCIYFFDHPKYAASKKKHQKMILKCVRVCRRITNYLFFGCIMGIVGFMGQVILKEDIHELPIKIWLPHVIKEEPKFYYTAYILLIADASYLALASGAIDPLIGGLPYQAAVQLQILKDNFKYLYQDINRLKINNNMVLNEKIYQEITRCSRHYQDIATFVQIFQSCFSLTVFSQFLESTTVIGLVCFQATKIPVTSFDFMVVALYMVLLFFQLFFYCYFGALLIEESTTFSTAIYMSRWYVYDKKSKEALIILMERCKRPMIISAGFILDLSLDTFTTILKRSYSLLAVLKNFQ